MTGVRFVALPPVPGLESFLELNVRTYVHFKGMPGIWFFSLDASKLIPVLAARLLFTLPYLRAEMGFAEDGIEFQSSPGAAVLRPQNSRPAGPAASGCARPTWTHWRFFSWKDTAFL